MELVSDFVVCEEGKPLSPEAARILVSYFVITHSSMPLLCVAAYSQLEHPVVVGIGEYKL